MDLSRGLGDVYKRQQLARAEKDLARTTIVSPMDGIISLMNVKEGERVVGTAQMAGTEMMRVADMKSIEVRVDVGENDITKVKLGDTALVEVDAYNNRKFKGIVYKIANPITAASGVSSAAEVANYKVHIRLLTDSYADLIKENAIFPFRPGMTASADIQTKSKVNVVSVPLNAVTTRDSDGKGKDTKVSSTANNNTEKEPAKEEVLNEVVFILQKDNKVKMVKVKTEIQDLNFIEVSGLKVGDQVITGPYSIVSKTLKDGSLVKVVTKEKLFEEK
jgi:HlyD family secretion protein